MKKFVLLFVVSALLGQSLARPDATAGAGTAVTVAAKAVGDEVKNTAAVPSTVIATGIAGVANQAESVPAKFGVNGFVGTGLNTAGQLYKSSNGFLKGLLGII